MIKRNLGEELSGQTHHSRNRQMRLLVVVHNCMILLLGWEVCDGAHAAPENGAIMSTYEERSKELHHDLLLHFAGDANTAVSHGWEDNVRWVCTARRDRSHCLIYCVGSETPQYLIYFKRDSDRIAMGYASSKPDMFCAVDEWLEHHQLSRLYERFSFVDEDKRLLAGMRDDMLALVPDLVEPPAPEALEQFGDRLSNHLWFGDLDRAFMISLWGENGLSDGQFHTDKCELFRFPSGDRARLAQVLKRWVCDRAMPSAMRREFPEIEIGELADYYEQGRLIEGEFIMSWDSIVQTYHESYFDDLPNVRTFIQQMRGRGYDKSLRAGTQLAWLILSRSRRHGLRQGQPSILFVFHKEGMNVHIRIDGYEELRLPSIELTPEIEALLKRLEAKDSLQAVDRLIEWTSARWVSSFAVWTIRAIVWAVRFQGTPRVGVRSLFQTVKRQPPLAFRGPSCGNT